MRDGVRLQLGGRREHRENALVLIKSVLNGVAAVLLQRCVTPGDWSLKHGQCIPAQTRPVIAQMLCLLTEESPCIPELAYAARAARISITTFAGCTGGKNLHRQSCRSQSEAAAALVARGSAYTRLTDRGASPGRSNSRDGCPAARPRLQMATVDHYGASQSPPRVYYARRRTHLSLG